MYASEESTENPTVIPTVFARANRGQAREFAGAYGGDTCWTTRGGAQTSARTSAAQLRHLYAGFLPLFTLELAYHR